MAADVVRLSGSGHTVKHEARLLMVLSPSPPIHDWVFLLVICVIFAIRVMSSYGCSSRILSGTSNNRGLRQTK